ncbi:MAG: DUF4976 domain-containing protein [Spirochaetes bacterium]|nr:MAG: DUF4976 domain-containing protein [Spirochaetota bacterium]
MSMDHDSFDGAARNAFSRRSLLKILGASAAAACADRLSPLARLARADARPNIIFILADDHRWDALGCMGHPFITTPHLDRLSREGVHFTNAFTTTSLCSPSRASFLTGQYAHAHGVRNNLTPWRDENVTFMELLKNAGYDTAFIGKWHMPGEGLPRLRGVDRFVSFTIQAGQGRYFDCPLYIDGGYSERPGTYITTDLTDLAIDYVSAPRQNPFCMYLSHKAVHQLFLPPPDLDHLYDNVDLKLPPEADSWVTYVRGMAFAGTVGAMEGYYRNYCECVVALDREVGRLLDTLDRTGLSRNTVVVYAGDNGFFWGEHRLADKRWAYEEAIRIPFIVRHPGLVPDPGRRATQMALNIDLAPTLLELAGVPVPANMEGRSLVPVLRSAAAPGRKAWLYENFKEFPYRVPEIRAVRTDSHIYMEYGSRRKPELYDVIADPREFNNLMDTAEGDRLLPALTAMLADLKEGREPL